MYINIYIKTHQPRRQNRRERWRGGCWQSGGRGDRPDDRGGDIRRAGRWYLVADEGGGRPLDGDRRGGGGLLLGMIRAHWAGSSPGRDQSGGGGAQRPGGIYAGATAGRQGWARGRQRGGQSRGCLWELWLQFWKIILFLSDSYDKKREGINLYKRLI